MIGVNVWWVYLAPQNIPRAVVLTLGNTILLYCIDLQCAKYWDDALMRSEVALCALR